MASVLGKVQSLMRNVTKIQLQQVSKLKCILSIHIKKITQFFSIKGCLKSMLHYFSTR